MAEATDTYPPFTVAGFAEWTTLLSNNDSSYANRKWAALFARNRWDIPLCAAVVYLTSVFLASYVFANRKPINVKWTFAVWNLALALFSIWGMLQTLPIVVYIQYAKGFRHTLCAPTFIWDMNHNMDHLRPAAGVFAFIFSKVFELLDTAFLILKNKRIRLLQWYHHTTVMLFCWHALAHTYPPGILFAAMNYIVHSVMYTYFFLATCRRKSQGLSNCLSAVAPYITVLQTVQMVLGTAINVGTIYLHWYVVEDCDVTNQTIQAAVIMYASYFVLFFKLWLDSKNHRAIKVKKNPKQNKQD